MRAFSVNMVLEIRTFIFQKVTSLWHREVHMIRIRTSWGIGAATMISSITNGSPGFRLTAATYHNTYSKTNGLITFFGHWFEETETTFIHQVTSKSYVYLCIEWASLLFHLMIFHPWRPTLYLLCLSHSLVLSYNAWLCLEMVGAESVALTRKLNRRWIYKAPSERQMNFFIFF